MSASASSSSRPWRGLVVVRVVGDDLDAQPLQAPSQRPGDGTETDQACRPPRHLPRPEPLVGDRAVAKHLARPDIRVGGQQVAGGPEKQGERHFRDGVGVAAGGVEHRDARTRWRRRRRRCSGRRGSRRWPAAAGRTPGRSPNHSRRQAHPRSPTRRVRPAARRCRSEAASARSTGRRPRRQARAACRNRDHAMEPSPGPEVASRLIMLAYGDPRVSQRASQSASTSAPPPSKPWPPTRTVAWWPGHEFLTGSGCLPPTASSTTPTRRGGGARWPPWPNSAGPTRSPSRSRPWCRR